MDVAAYSPLSARLKIDGGGSSTAFASATGSRWVLKGGLISWANLDSSTTYSLYEFNATNSALFFTGMATTTHGIVDFCFSDYGVPASSSYASRMVFNVGSIAGTFCALFTGYQIGG